MPILHYLNVKHGDCTAIQHGSGRVSVIDVCNAKADTLQGRIEESVAKAFAAVHVSGNFNQKEYPVNPVTYLKDSGISSVWRFILTHPDMDHMDGLKVFWDAFSPSNFWDTANTCDKESDFKNGSPYDYADWSFYKKLRAGKAPEGVTRLTLYSGAIGAFYNRAENNSTGGDGISVLAPTPELVADANSCEDFNDCSYVLLYRACKFKILLAGDSHDATWDHILSAHRESVSDVDLLIAPHHGRKSDRSYEFLDVLRPKMTFFGNAASEHLAYSAWNYRKLPFVTNNQANCMVVEATDTSLDLYVTNEAYARASNQYTFYSERLRAWYAQEIAAN